MTSFKKGDVVELVEVYWGYKVGHRFTVISTGETGCDASGQLVYGYELAVFGSRLKLAKREVTRENLSTEKLYIVTAEHHQFNKGDVVYVDEDDGTNRPFFTKVNAAGTADTNRAMNICKVEEWTPLYKTEPEVTEVTLEQIAAKFDIPTDQLRIKD